MRVKYFLAASVCVFALVGIATTMMGPLLPLLAPRWMLTDSQSGLLFVAQFCGGFLGAIASTKLMRKISAHITMRTGLLLTATGVACVPCTSLWLVAGGISLYGIGIGLATASISVSVCEALPSQQARSLNALNLFWALGAITAPGMISRLVLRTPLGLRGTLSIAAAALITAAFIIPPLNTAATAGGTSSVPFSARDFRLMQVTGALIFIYVGIENGIAGWLPTFAQRIEGFTLENSALLQEAFWAALLICRLLSAIWIRRGREHLFLAAAMFTLTIGTALLLLNHSQPWLYICVVLIGVGCAPIFPTTVAILSQQLSSQCREQLGWMFAAGGLGGAVFPFCIGVLSTATSNLRVGMCLLLLGEVVMLVVHATMRQIGSRVAAQRG